MTKILIIEDTLQLREDILLILGYEGYQARGAENGLEGVRVAQEWQPNMIICDVRMPGLDGYGVLMALHNIPELAHIPFMFLTATAEVEAIQKGIALGAVSYLIKPFTTQTLLATIRAQVAK